MFFEEEYFDSDPKHNNGTEIKNNNSRIDNKEINSYFRRNDMNPNRNSE